ncbi:MAG: nucleotidyltransferase domain-containing protein [Desulfurococcaceae archaeon]
MVREKITRRSEYRVVNYSDEHWRLLRDLRSIAIEILKVLHKRGIEAYVHGSVARGDVKKNSDVDIVILDPIPPYLVEHVLEENNIEVIARYIIVATPTCTPKAKIVLDSEEKRTISFPLYPYKPREFEFYKFGGIIDLNELLKEKRVPGVNKKLMFIEPTEQGHVEFSIMGYENLVASKLGISIETVYERVSVLSRRDEIGRTGIFVEYMLNPEETFEEALENILKKHSIIKESLKDRM